MEPIKPRFRMNDQQREALRRMQDFRPMTSTKSPVQGDTAPVPTTSPQPESGSEDVPIRRLPLASEQKKKRAKWPFIAGVIIAVLLLGGGAAAWWFKIRKQPAAPAVNSANTTVDSPASQTPAAPTTVRLIASGDELPHESISKTAKTASGYDYTPFYTTIKPYFQAADLRFCNQETPSAGEQLGVTGYPVFNVSKQFAKDINTVGCNVINLANNHTNDKGQQGINETLSIWDELKPKAYAGINRNPEEQRKVRYFTEKEVKFAFVAYTEISNTTPSTAYGLNTLTDKLVTQQLSEARTQADVVLVSVHWGTEYSDGINPAQETWAKKFADLGADVVLGTGPHVLEPVKRLPRAGGGETLVWYSVGNMLSAQLDVPSLIGGFAVMDINPASKKVEKIGFLPTYMHYEWTAAQKAAEDLLSRKNYQIYPLDKAAEPLKRSQNNTTVEAQTQRVQALLNKYTAVPVLTSDQYLAR
jgi:poly-gamma-glutamate capsule biosynthesis protein CapA/YwtB (metallophosphatase superfamily)